MICQHDLRQSTPWNTETNVSQLIEQEQKFVCGVPVLLAMITGGLEGCVVSSMISLINSATPAGVVSAVGFRGVEWPPLGISGQIHLYLSEREGTTFLQKSGYGA